MIKTTYHCDKCEVQVEKKNDLAEVEIKLSYYEKYWNSRVKTLHLCTDCAVKVGVFRKDYPPRVETPNVADQLYDIFADMVEDAVANQ